MLNRKIKVMQFIISFGIGGAENIAKQYCKLINRDDFEVMVVAIGNQHSYHDIELKQCGIDVIYLNDIIDERYSSFNRQGKRIMRHILRPLYLRKIMRDFNPDIVHYHLPCSKLILKSKPKKGTKFFLTVHSDPTYFWGKKSQWKSDYGATKKLAKKYDFTFIALHDEMKDLIDKVWYKKIRHNTIILNNGIELEKFKDLPSRNEILDEMGIENDSLVIGHVGSFINVKNHDYLIDVFNNVYEKNSNSVLLLIGNGVNKKAIEEKVEKLKLKDCVRFLGVRDDIPEIMKAMDILVFPSFTEGISLTLIEAQVSGLKCIVSDTVPKYNNISVNLIHFADLKKGPEYWANEIFKVISENKKYSCDTSAWSITEVVKLLEKEYRKVC